MLIAACRSYGEITGKRIFFEWTLIAGKNDSPETARRLAKLLDGIDSHINLIPLNPTGGFPRTVRQRRGIDVAAGCGMLKADKRVRMA